MKIPWILCTDRMPTDHEEIIIKDGYGTHRCDGKTVNNDYGICVELKAEWIPYDEATWKELNNDV